jgi:hypothetical protein
MIKLIRSWFKKLEVKPVQEPYRVTFKLDGVKPYTDIEAWELDKQLVFFNECKRLLENDTLRTIFDNELQDIANHAFTQSTGEEFFYARFEARGVARIREKLEDYANRIEQQITYDQHDYLPN